MNQSKTKERESRSSRTVRLEEQRWVTTPQDQVFEFTADFSNSEKWDPGVVSSVKISDGPVGVGTMYDLEVKFGSGTIPMVYEITEYEPDTRVVLLGRGEKLTAVDEITFAFADNMTVIDYTADLTFYNYFKYLGPLLNRPLRGVGEKALDGLVAALER